MDDFLRRCREELSTGHNANEKEWEQTFYLDVEKCIRQSEGDIEFADICFSVLSAIRQLRSGDKQSYSSYWIPVNQKVTPLEALIQHSQDVVKGGLVNNVLCSDIIPGFKPVAVVPYILLGYLTHCPKSAQNATTAAALFLEDNYNAIICELINPEKEWMNKVVIISDWNYIPAFSTSSAPVYSSNTKGNSTSIRDFKSGYIEVTGKCVPVIAAKAERVIVPKSVTLTEYEQDKRLSSNVNIRGNVFALSPIHSMRDGKPFFFLKLFCSEANTATMIVIQGEHFLFWYHFLQIDNQYIFTSLRQTTMNKGTRNERKILAVSRRSSFFKCKVGNVMSQQGDKRRNDAMEIKCKRVRAESQDQATDHNLGNDTVVIQKEDVCLQPDTGHDSMEQKLPVTLSYTGVITKCVKPEGGVYELDHKIRLYINHQPSTNLGRGLRVGAHVTAYNVHLCKRGKKVLGLCCCTQSMVRVVKFSPLSSPWKPFSPCESPLALLGQNLALADYVEFLDICEQILVKFSPLYRTRQLITYSARHHGKESSTKTKPSVVEMLLSFTRGNSVIANHPTRNIYDEFFDQPHECYPNRASVLSFPWVPTLKQFLDTVHQTSCEHTWHDGVLSDTMTTQEKKGWVYQILCHHSFDQSMVLIGCLRGSSKTGQLYLCDQSGEIDCVIAPSDYKAEEHCCATDCCVELLEGRNSYRCPYAQIWHLGSMIQINEFDVVMEKFKPNHSADNDSCQNEPRIYVQFSFNAAEVLISNDSKPVKENGVRNFRTDEKLSKELEKSDGKELTCEIHFVVRNCEIPMLRNVTKEVCYPCGVEIKIVGVSSSLLQSSSLTSHEYRLSSSSAELCSKSGSVLREFTLQRKNAALKLSNRTLCWSHFLHHGCFYVIRERVSEEKSSRIISGGTLKLLIEVDTNMVLTRICWCQRCRVTSRMVEDNRSITHGLEEAMEDLIKEDKMQSVDDILTDGTCQKGEKGCSVPKSRQTSTQISFRGLISSRDLRQSDTPIHTLPKGLIEVPKFGLVRQSALKNLDVAFCLFNNNILQLRVRDVESRNTISVYLDLRRGKYICGILPGAILQFRRFIRTFSRTGNMYCTFEACSSIVIERRAGANSTDVCPIEQLSSLNPGTEENRKQLANRFLIELIRSETQGYFVQTISRLRCRVTAVQKASVRWQCKRCGELVERGECINGCSTVGGFKFNSEARCVIEDGTAEAQLYVYDDMVPTLLKLSDQQWYYLKDLAMRLGELTYQRHWPGRNCWLKPSEEQVSSREAEAKIILGNHCCSSVIHRTMVIQCTVYRFNKEAASKTHEGYESRSIIVGPTEHSTLVLPKLRLRAVHMNDACAVEEIHGLLKSVTSQKDATEEASSSVSGDSDHGLSES